MDKFLILLLLQLTLLFFSFVTNVCTNDDIFNISLIIYIISLWQVNKSMSY